MSRIIQTGEAIRQNGAKLVTVIPVRIRRHGGHKVVISAAGSAQNPSHDAPILTALSKAFHWQRLLDEGFAESGADIARREGVHPTTVSELLRLTLLSPSLVRAILDGQQPKTLTLLWLKNHALPLDWDDQQALFEGFDA